MIRGAAMSLTLRPTSRILSSFVGDRFLHSTPPLHQLFRYSPGHLLHFLSSSFGTMTSANSIGLMVSHF